MIDRESCDAPKCKEHLDMFHAADLRLFQWAAEKFAWRYVQDGWLMVARVGPRPPRVWS